MNETNELLKLLVAAHVGRIADEIQTSEKLPKALVKAGIWKEIKPVEQISREESLTFAMGLLILEKNFIFPAQDT